MFQFRPPLHVFVPANVDGTRLVFRAEPHSILVRYESVPGRPEISPSLRHESSPWSIGGAPLLSDNFGAIRLKFNGAAMNALVDQNCEHPMYLAFLDQRTIELEFVMRIGPPGEAPCDSDELAHAGLFLKLGFVPY